MASGAPGSLVGIINEKDWCKNAEAYRSCRSRFEAVARHLALFWLWCDRSRVRWRKSSRVVQ
jgi:hypothetical protein